MKVILFSIGLICFGLIGFLYYDFCKRISDVMLNILENEKNKKEGGEKE